MPAQLPVVDGYVLHAAEVSGHPRDVPATRRSVSEALRGTGVDGDTVDTVELLLTELVTNAVRHGRGPVTVRVVLVHRGTLRVDVHDLAPGQVVPVDLDLWSTGGRGLAMVDLLSYQWGCRSTLDGKSVWCEVVPVSVSAVQAPTSDTLAP